VDQTKDPEHVRIHFVLQDDVLFDSMRDLIKGNTAPTAPRR
jgi:hypothetical protein